MDGVNDLLEKGIVSQGRQKWRVHEDGVLANEMQDSEFQQHYGWNRLTRRTVREDVNLARVVQTEEELLHDKKQKHHREAMKFQGPNLRYDDDNEFLNYIQSNVQAEEAYLEQMEHIQDDEILARALQKSEKENYRCYQEKCRIKKLHEERRRLSAAAMAIAAAINSSSGSANARVIDAYVSGHDNLTQEQRDELLAKQLQEQESVHRLNVMSYQEEAAELDDRLAKVIAELDALRLRRYERREREGRSLREQSSREDRPGCSNAPTDNIHMSHHQRNKTKYLKTSENLATSDLDKIRTTPVHTSPEPQRYAFADSSSPSCSNAPTDNMLSSNHQKNKTRYFETSEILTTSDLDKSMTTSAQTPPEPQRYAFAGSGSPLISYRYRGNPLLRLDEKILSGAADGGLIVLPPTNSDRNTSTVSSHSSTATSAKTYASRSYENMERLSGSFEPVEIATTPFGPTYNIAAALDPTYKPHDRIQQRRSYKNVSSEPLRGDRRRSVDSNGAKSYGS